ncbi:MAG: ubiquinol-cytochrome C chaperone family protein [Pseudomonadota bacterium]
MAGIFDWMKVRPDPAATAAQELCDAVMAQARAPALYQARLAEDTFEGRFGMMALHGGLLMRRLGAAGPEGREMAEKLGEALFDRIDYALREEGVGDASIARKVRKLGEEFYGLARALDGVLGGEAATAAGIGQVLRRNGLGGAQPDALAREVIARASRLDRCTDEELLCGRVGWGDERCNG